MSFAIHLSAGPLVGALLSMQPEPLAVAWEAPAGCIDSKQAEARLRELLPELAPAVGTDVEAKLRAEVEIVPSEAGFRATVRFEGPLGHDERSFEDESCAIVSEAALLVLAVSVDPIATVESLELAEPSVQRPRTVVSEEDPDPPPSPSPETETDPNETTEFGPIISTAAPPIEFEEEAPAVRRPKPRVRPERTTRVRTGLGLLGGGGYGPLTLGQGSFGGELSAFGPWWRATLRGLWLTPRTVTPAGSRAARYDGFSIGALGCGVPSVRTLEFPMCLGLEAGLLSGQGTGTTPDPRKGSRPNAALVIAPGLRWAVHERLALVLDVGLLVPLLRGGFTIEGAVAASIAPAGVRALAGLELRLP